MSVIIRLQNLPWSANALDIRQYFSGLSIPEGGVHIVGGELGDAFIAFSTDEDARQAFLRNNGKIREIQISLMLSSRTEMQRVIEQARAKSYAAFMQPQAAVPTPAPVPAQVPLPAAVPQIIPAAVPELKKEKEFNRDKPDKRDSRRRSRSKSKERDRRDRSRDKDRKDRRYRDRSRSKSRDRKSSRRRDRSRSRNRSRSRDRDRRNSSRDFRKRSEEKTTPPVFQKDQRKPEVWGAPIKPNDLPQVLPQQTALLQAGFQVNPMNPHLNGFPNTGAPVNFPLADNMGRNSRDSWPPTNQGNFPPNRNSDDFNNGSDHFPGNGRFRKRFFEGDTAISLQPFYGGYSDIRKFFHGMFISNRGIKCINDSNGRRTGIVYVQFSSKRAKDEALGMNGRMLNGLEINIRHIEDSVFEEACDRFVPSSTKNYDDNNTNDKFKGRLGPKVYNNKKDIVEEPELKEFSCLTVEDLPTYVKEQDILHMFQMHPLVALNLVTRRRGGPIAYVKFGGKEEAKKAFEEAAHHVVGGKPVTVKPCSDEDFDEINKQHDATLGSPKIEDIGTDCLSISKLPQKTTDKDIADFFSDIGVIPTKIHLMSNNLGFTGEAYCEFMNSEEATRASKKNDTMLGSTSISVVPISRQDMNRVLGSAFPAPLEQTPAIMMGMKDSDIPSPDRERFPGGNPPMDMFPGPNNRGGFFNNRNKFDYDGPPRALMQTRFQPPRGGGGGGGPRMRFQAPMDGEDVPPGCTVYLKNVPYKATTDDILDFFEGYNHTGSVSRRYNPNNTPTDEAKISFYDPDEASRAVDDLQKMKIWDRPIFLKQE